MDTRLEFLVDLGDGPRVLAFVNFETSALSFGCPKSFQLKQFDGDQNFIDFESRNYERTTIHKDGQVNTRLPLGAEIPAGWDDKLAALAAWDKLWYRRYEVYWHGGLDSLVEGYLPTPKTNRRCRHIPIKFAKGVESTKVYFAVLPSWETALNEIPWVLHPDYTTWVLIDAWPYVLLSMSGLAGSHDRVDLTAVGRDYRT